MQLYFLAVYVYTLDENPCPSHSRLGLIQGDNKKPVPGFSLIKKNHLKNSNKNLHVQKWNNGEHCVKISKRYLLYLLYNGMKKKGLYFKEMEEMNVKKISYFKKDGVFST